MGLRPAGSTSPTDSGQESGSRLKGNRTLAGDTREDLVIRSRVMVTAGTLGTELRALRELRGLSQTDLANELGVSRAQVSQVENGHYIPGLASVVRFLEVLDAHLEIELDEGGSIEPSRGGEPPQ